MTRGKDAPLETRHRRRTYTACGVRRRSSGTSFSDAFAGGEGRGPSLSHPFQAPSCRGPGSPV